MSVVVLVTAVVFIVIVVVFMVMLVRVVMAACAAVPLAHMAVCGHCLIVFAVHSFYPSRSSITWSNAMAKISPMWASSRE